MAKRYANEKSPFELARRLNEQAKRSIEILLTYHDLLWCSPKNPTSTVPYRTVLTLNLDWKSYKDPIITSTLITFDWNQGKYLDTSNAIRSSGALYVSKDYASFILEFPLMKKNLRIVDIPFGRAGELSTILDEVHDFEDEFPNSKTKITYYDLKKLIENGNK